MAKVISAAVTVKLNNDDGRFPLNDTRVAIRRVVSATGDQYFVNDSLTKVEQLLALLETSKLLKRRLPDCAPASGP